MKKLIITSVFCAVVSLTVFGQNDAPKYNVPEDYSFTLPEDYTAYEPQIKEAIDWYLWRSLAFDADKRQTAGAFFFKWLIGTPTVTVDIHPDIVNFSANNPELILPFAMGWTKFAIDNPTHSKDPIKGSHAGIEAAVDYYNKNRGFLKKDENIEKYEKMIKKNKLENYIKKHLPKKEDDIK